MVFMAVGAAVFAAFQIGKMPSALPALRADLDLSLVAAGWTISMFSVIGVATGVAVGAVADWIGHRRAILFGLLCTAAGSGLGALADGAAVILATRFLEGVGAFAVFVAGPGFFVKRARPEDLRLAFGVWGTYMPTGTALMVLATPPLLDWVGWRGLWIVNAVLLAGFAVMMALVIRAEPVRSAPRRSLAEVLAGLVHDIRLTLAAPSPLLLGLCFATYTANYLAVLGFLPTFLIEDLGVTGTAAAVMTAFAIAVNVLGNLLGGWLLHRSVARWVLIVAASLIMAGCSIGLYSDALGADLRYWMAVAYSGLGGMLPAAVLGAAPVHAPRPNLVATVNGLIMQGSHLGQITGPPALAAMVAAAGGWHVSPVLVGGLALVGVALALWIGAIERRMERG